MVGDKKKLWGTRETEMGGKWTKAFSFIDKMRERKREKNEFYEIQPPLLLFSPLCKRIGGPTQHHIRGMTMTMMNYIPPLLPIRIQNLTPLSAIGQKQEASLSLRKKTLFFFSAASVIITMGKHPAPLFPFILDWGIKRRDREKGGK